MMTMLAVLQITMVIFTVFFTVSWILANIAYHRKFIGFTGWAGYISFAALTGLILYELWFLVPVTMGTSM